MPLGHISGYKVTYKFPKYRLEGDWGGKELTNRAIRKGKVWA